MPWEANGPSPRRISLPVVLQVNGSDPGQGRTGIYQGANDSESLGVKGWSFRSIIGKVTFACKPCPCQLK
jgi:hypothetical protein